MCHLLRKEGYGQSEVHRLSRIEHTYQHQNFRGQSPNISTDTSVNEAREECVRVVIDSSKRLVVLDQIKTMEAEIENPHFKKVSFL